MRLLWLPDVLSDAGLRVGTHPGWETKGVEFSQSLAGWMEHHTGSKSGNAPCYDLCYFGRSDLPGPLCQDLLARDGTFFVIASGRANHAGKGSWQGVSDGNGRFGGTEAEHSGFTSEPWTAHMYDAYVVGTAAKLRYLGRDASWACGHKEYALPPGRKPDPIFDMVRFRSDVASLLSGPPLPEEDDVTPAVCYDRDGNRWVFVHGTQHDLWVKKNNEPWSGVGGVVTSGVGAAAKPDGSVTALVRGQDGAAWEWNSVSGWTSLGGSIAPSV